ncbi:hypothetical protein TSOC_003063 [Tetrabaena socialis]|uniref:Uncharacterized protein n=1 Tax=Tetrabaena socialis TaxID=47790 RepID=A0A2J8ACL9_9CHLO|nr:hypothetical protein TSOC_003063 [Tetrabaena socialis]|eukprot:PNH10258.1 hypothetical protein TSOC_003063 [Tetrabaena socialis]
MERGEDRPRPVPTLKEASVNALIKYRQFLGDVGFIDEESLRAICWHCNPEQLRTVEDDTLSGSGRQLEWYTWHLWKRLLASELGATNLKLPALRSPQPVDYTPPRTALDAQPGDYRALFAQRKAELDERAAVARERLAVSYQQAQEEKDSRKAKMIDKLQPSKRPRASGGAVRGQGAPPASAFMHKPHAHSRSTLLAKPGAQLKMLKDLGLVKPGGGGARPAVVVRDTRPAPVSAAAVGHSSSLAGAQMLARTTGGLLGRAGGAGGSRGDGGAAPLHREAQPPLAAARAAAVAAVAASRAASAAGGGGGSSSASAAAAAPSTSSLRGGANGGRPPHGHSPAASVGGGKRPTTSSEAEALEPPRKQARTTDQPDPRVLFPRKNPPPGGSKFAVPTVRPSPALAAATVPQRPQTTDVRPSAPPIAMTVRALRAAAAASTHGALSMSDDL